MAADGPAPYIPLLGSADRAKSTRASSLALGGIALGALLLVAAGPELFPFPAQLLQLPLKSFEASATVAARPPDAVTSLPGAPPLDTVQYAGLVTVNSTARNKLFYWFAESSRVKDGLEEKSKVPIVIWLNGGPGASSMTGWLVEKIGPFELQSDAATLTPTGLPWHELAHVMMWDQPVGAGYATTATGTYAASMEEAAADLLKGMTEFYKIHPEYKDSDVYVTGESFAGKWIPHFCYHVYETNKALVAKGEPVAIPLVGMAIGNGVLYPYLQSEAMVTMATGLGYTDPEKLRVARKNLKACKQELEAIDEMKERPVPSHDLWKSAYFKCDALEKIFGEAVKFIYDIRSPADEFSALSEYLNKEEVRKALNVGETKWVQQDGGKPGNPVSDALWEPQISDLPDEMLATLFNEYKVLMYAGQYDGSSCNALGVAQSVDVVANEGKWADASKYANATACTWTVNGIPAGVLRATGKFGNLVFLNSGHLVPMNQPAAGYEMIRQLVYSDTFTDMC